MDGPRACRCDAPRPGAAAPRSPRAHPGLARRFAGDERGVTAIALAIMFAVVLYMAALAVDDSRFTSEWMQDRNALDAALLAASHTIGQPDAEEAARARAEAFYTANRPDGARFDLKTLELDRDAGTIAGQTSFDWKTTLLRAVGHEQARLGSGAEVQRGTSAEVVLVLDNSSWMEGAPIEDLKAAAQKLTEVLFVGRGGGADRSIKVGVVPFASAVNVDPSNSDADWIDSAGLSPVHRENYQHYGSGGGTLPTRFELFERLSTQWAGCVESRPGTHELADSPADPEDPSSLFVPMFAPDEPDDANNPDAQAGATSGFFYNSYLDDNPTPGCPPQEQVCTSTSRRGNCNKWSITPLPPAQAQRQLCKYDGVQTPAAGSITFKRGPTMRKGPNFGCESVPLLALTSSRALVDAKLHEMTAIGAANISEGIMWGHRVISPAAPFMEGAPFDDKQTRKFVVLLARGANFIEAFRDQVPNHSIYSTWGFGAQDRLNPQSHTDSALTNAMNSKSREACRLVTDAGVKLYTIGFGVASAHTRSMLQYCASHPSMFFDVDKGDELLQVFERIGREISELRVTG